MSDIYNTLFCLELDPAQVNPNPTFLMVTSVQKPSMANKLKGHVQILLVKM